MTLEVEVDGYAGQCKRIVRSAGDLRNFLCLLGRAGVRPRGRGREDWVELPDGSILCPKHRVAMRKRLKQGSEWFSHRVACDDGLERYCKGRAGTDSPGYDFDMPAHAED